MKRLSGSDNSVDAERALWLWGYVGMYDHMPVKLFLFISAFACIWLGWLVVSVRLFAALGDGLTARRKKRFSLVQ